LVAQQVKAACLGVAQSVKDLQTKTGVKDGFTQYWIDQLIERARVIQKDQPERSAADIQSELMDWVINNQNEIYNPFLTMEGEPPIDLPPNPSLQLKIFLQGSTHPSIPQLRFSTQSS
jgi:hypothetical protein